MSINGLFSRGYHRDEENNEPKAVIPIHLDAQQETAVLSNEPDIIVVAGAGSGKTRVLTERVKRLISSGIKPHNIVAITFTNLAAEEMRERLGDVEGIGDAFIGTIHSFANKIMQLSGIDYTLYNDDVDNQFHEELIGKYCSSLTFAKYTKYKDLQAFVEIGKVSDRELENFFVPSERAEFNKLHRSIQEVEDERNLSTFPESIATLCRDRNVITFDELLVKADEYFRSLDARIEHLLVDEFQDVGTLEFHFFEALNAENNFFVGDDYQAIYGFKGGNVNLFLTIVEDSDFVRYYLTNNYRNSEEILTLANTVISQVFGKIEKTIVPKVNEHGTVKISSKRNLYSDALKVIKDSGDYREWFILTRTNKELFLMASECERAGIPYVTFKREGLTLRELNAYMKSNKVKILTVHTSKGLEAENVVLYGNFPVYCPSYRNSEEERKVMYVGVTRAKKNLIILN